MSAMLALLQDSSRTDIWLAYLPGKAVALMGPSIRLATIDKSKHLDARLGGSRWNSYCDCNPTRAQRANHCVDDRDGSGAVNGGIDSLALGDAVDFGDTIRGV